ncbi:hypothetical protein FG386_001177 [Cryptosporidium ryanae]|uniref:uncharacterized protein n=1 Tax=Cryptosporidium ryanae TaxID=515981 RepID=UPI00351A01A3|nr:hypothetical protein FG386_001177 [Cryptosporidium ryanae]
MNDYFNQGIEHINNRITKCEREISELANKTQLLVTKKSELEREIRMIDGFCDSLTEIYELLHNVSKFHDKNYSTLKYIFTSRLKRVNIEYSDRKREMLSKNNTFLSESEITKDYTRNRNLIIKELINSLSGKITEIDRLLSSVNNINDIDRNYYLKITKSDRLIKILVCYIYINLILWDPFCKNQISLNEFIKSYNFLDGGDSLIGTCKFEVLFNWTSLLKEINFKKGVLFDIKSKINSMYINEYIFEILNNYWYPVNVFETDNLINSIICFKKNLNLVIDKYKPTMIDKYYYFLDIIKSNYYKNNIYDEYQFIYNLLNWFFSFHIFINKFEIEDSLKEQLINKTKNIILELIQLDNKDTNTQNSIGLLSNIKINVYKLVNLFSKVNHSKQELSNSILEVIRCNEGVFPKLNPINMNYIYDTIYRNFIDYNINYCKIKQ